MHVTYVSNLYPPAVGGAQIHLHCLAKGVKRAGKQVSVITLTSRYRRDWVRLSTILTDREKRYSYEGIAVTQIGFPWDVRVRLLPWAATYYACMGLATKKIANFMLPYFEKLDPPPSIVHVTRNGREFLAQAALDYARRHGIPFVLTPNHHPRWKGFLYREYDRIYREADALLALTEAEKDTLVREKGVPEERVHVTGVGPVLCESSCPEAFRARFNINRRFILFLGQQHRYKGLDAVLESASSVWRQHPDVMFVFIGPQTTHSSKVFRGWANDNCVVNLGEVDLETKTSALAACEFLCVPSAQESFGGVYVEAWSLHKAVIGGRIPPIASVITHGKDGLLCSQDPGELAAMICHLLSHPEDCRSMGDAGHQKVKEKYTWDQMVRKTIAVYEALCPQVAEHPVEPRH
jgi:glycosyltransferase involved in cell wall biosynthesis